MECTNKSTVLEKQNDLFALGHHVCPMSMLTLLYILKLQYYNRFTLSTQPRWLYFCDCLLS